MSNLFKKNKDDSNSYVVLAVPAMAASIIEIKMLEDVEQQLKDAWMTNFVILAPGVANKPQNLTLVKHLTDVGHEWAAKRIVYQLTDENVRDFVRRVCSDYEVTHFVDTRKTCLEHVATDPYLTSVKIYQAKPKNWMSVRGWIFKTSPQFYQPLDKAPDAFHIIETGASLVIEEGMVQDA